MLSDLKKKKITKTLRKATLGRKRFIWLIPLYRTPLLREVSAGPQGRNPEADIEAETMERGAAYWLAPSDCLGLISDTTQNHLPRSGTIHSEVLPHQAFNQENAPPSPPPPRLLTGQFHGEIVFQLDFPLLRWL